MSENLPAKSEGINFDDPRMVQTLRHTVAQGATDAEFAMYVQFCRSTGLNPFKREIWFIKAGGRVQMMTGIQGFFAIANSDPQFDGHESGLIDPNGAMVPGSYPKEDYIGAWCKVYRKDRRIPSEGIAMLREYDKGQGNWPKMKRVMILKCAESVALRKAFPQQLNGLYTQEEFSEAPEPIPAAKVDNVSVLPTAKPARTYRYDLRAIPHETRADIEAFLYEHRVPELSPGVWETTRPIAKFAKYLVKDEEQKEIAANGS